LSRKTIAVDDRLYEYLLSVSLREPQILGRLRNETASHRAAGMQISPEQGPFMQLLVRLAVALALPADGYLLACDVNPEYTAIARRYWAEAGVADRIELVLAPAIDTLDARLAAGEEASYDFAFIDADKAGYPAYYERALRLLRPGGLIAVDNTLWDGAVADAADQSGDTRAIRRFNETLRIDERVDLSLVPIGDGLTLARKRG
jgi:predicted O-methyltransferase YrrM